MKCDKDGATFHFMWIIQINVAIIDSQKKAATIGQCPSALAWFWLLGLLDRSRDTANCLLGNETHEK